jgi:hypothetical protein
MSSLRSSISEPEAKILMDAQEKEVDNGEKDDKNYSYDNDMDEVNIEELKLQDSADGHDDDVCITEFLYWIYKE